MLSTNSIVVEGQDGKWFHDQKQIEGIIIQKLKTKVQNEKTSQFDEQDSGFNDAGTVGMLPTTSILVEGRQGKWFRDQK